MKSYPVFTTASSSKVTKATTDAAAGVYATCADFRRVFNDHVDRLYTLALLLTANCELAEHCYLSAFEQCALSTTVFREWAESWAKRTMITTAIRIVFGSQIPANNHVRTESVEGPISGVEILLARVSRFEPLDRFFYVMSVLETMSVTECALLLGCSVRDVVDAKIRALQRICDVLRFDPEYQGDRECV